MYKLCFFSFVLALMIGAGFAQVSGYVFSYSMGTYSEITGGSVLATATVGGTGTNSLDEGFYEHTPIPFAFHYNGLPYSEVAVSCNGYLILGGAVAMGYNPISSTYAGDGVIAALARDLQGNVDAGNLGEVRYQTLNTEPNRVFVVQWKNFRRYAGVNEDYNFQIRLHESDDVIEFVYGEMLVNYTGSTHPQCGLRGATSADFCNRAVSTDWANSQAGTNNTAMATLSTTVYPALGTSYAFSVTVTTLPNPVVMLYPEDNGWTYTSGILKWRQNGGYPSSFNLYFGESTDPPLLATIGTQDYAPVMEPNTTYYWKVEAQNIFGTAAGTVRSFQTPGTGQLQESFENTVFPPIGWANPGSWSRSTTSPYHLTAGAYKSANVTPALLSTPKLTITSGSSLVFYYKTGSTNGYARLQLVYSPDRVNWNPIGSVLIPPTTNSWVYHNQDLSTIPGDYFLGFQAFTITSTASVYIDHLIGPEITSEVPGPVTLISPPDTATNVNPLVTFTWSAPLMGGIPEGYRLYCDTEPNPTTLQATLTGYTYSLSTSLLYGTLYYWKVVAYNTVGESTGNPVNSFTTWADPTISVFPWSESFDGTIFAPLGWNNIKTAGTSVPGVWDRVTSGNYPTCTPHSGAGMARYNSYSIQSGGRAELITPPLDIPEGSLYKIRFWMFRDSGYSSKTGEGVNVHVNTTTSSAGGMLLGTIHRYYEYSPAVTEPNLWYQYSFTFVAPNAPVYLIFEGISEYGNNIFVDDVQVLMADPPAAPILSYPADQAVGLPQSGFDFQWSPDLVHGDIPQYYVLYIATAIETIYDEYLYDNITGTSYNPTTDPGTPLTFAYGTQYFWTVQAVNASGSAVAEPPREFSTGLQAPQVTISVNPLGEIGLDWSPGVTGATDYRVESSASPSGPWIEETTTPGLSWSTAAVDVRFYRVTASQD